MIGREVIIAIDPGALGAIAVLIDGTLEEVEDMPHLVMEIGGTNRRRVDPYTLDGLLKSMVSSHVGLVDDFCCVVEEVGPMPKDGSTQAFNFGCAYMAVVMAFVVNRWPMHRITPPVWKRGLKLRKGKDASRQRAMELFPAFSGEFARVKDDGRAEAALLGHYVHLQRRKGEL